MIQFNLKDLKEIQPWGDESKRTLHWFALTDSYYWFNFDGIEFPKYNKEIIKEWNLDINLRYVDYHFARIFWDICDVLRHVEIPVPDEVFEKVNSLEKLENYLTSSKDWLEFTWDESEEQYDEVYEVAREWLYFRKLDFGYLTGGPDLFLIRNNNQIYLYWFSGYKNDNGISIWDRPRGEYSCNYLDFINHLVDTFKSFGLEIRKQISRVLKNTPVNVFIDSEQLLLNQKQYEESVTAIERKELLYAELPNWINIMDKINVIINSRKS